LFCFFIFFVSFVSQTKLIYQLFIARKIHALFFPHLKAIHMVASGCAIVRHLLLTTSNTAHATYAKIQYVRIFIANRTCNTTVNGSLCICYSRLWH